MSIRAASGVATALGSVTLVACLIAVPVIYNEVQEIRAILDTEMDVFKVNKFVYQ